MSDVLNFTAKDLLSPGKINELPITLTDGRDGLVYRRDLPAGNVIDFAESEEGPERNEMLLRLVAQAICKDTQGTPMFSEMDLDELRNMPIGVFQQMATAVTEASGVTVGETEGNA